MSTIIKKHVLLPLLFTMWCGQVHSQAPPGHADVWKDIQTYWSLWAQRDMDGFVKYHHSGYSGWDYEDSMHKGKQSTVKWLDHAFRTKEIVTYDISPVDIKIHDDTAIVHYYYSILEKDHNGNEAKISGRRTDVLIWEKQMWTIVATHGGRMDKN